MVTSDAFGPALKKMRILMVNDCHYLPVPVTSSHLVLAQLTTLRSAAASLVSGRVGELTVEGAFESERRVDSVWANLGPITPLDARFLFARRDQFGVVLSL